MNRPKSPILQPRSRAVRGNRSGIFLVAETSKAGLKCLPLHRVDPGPLVCVLRAANDVLYGPFGIDRRGSGRREEYLTAPGGCHRLAPIEKVTLTRGPRALWFGYLTAAGMIKTSSAPVRARNCIFCCTLDNALLDRKDAFDQLQPSCYRIAPPQRSM